MALKAQRENILHRLMTDISTQHLNCVIPAALATLMVGESASPGLFFLSEAKVASVVSGVL